jgi:hypothetical protein
VNTYALWDALAVARGTLRVILFASFAVPFKTRKLFAVISELNLAAEMNSVILNAILELEYVGGINDGERRRNSKACRLREKQERIAAETAASRWRRLNVQCPDDWSFVRKQEIT